MKQIKLVSKKMDGDGDKDNSPKNEGNGKVKATYSTNAPGIDKKKTLINKGKFKTIVTKSAELPMASKEKGIAKGNPKTEIGKSFNKLNKIISKPRTAKKLGEAKQKLKSTALTQGQIKKAVGGIKAKKIVKYAEKANRVDTTTKVAVSGVKNKHYQSTLKKK